VNRLTGREAAASAATLVVLAAALRVVGPHLPDWLVAVVAYPVGAALVGLVMQATFFRMTRRQSVAGFVVLALACGGYVVWVGPRLPATTWWPFGLVVAFAVMCLLAGPHRPFDLTELGDRRVTVTDFGPRPTLVEWEARETRDATLVDARLRSAPWHAATNVSEAAAEELAARMRRRGATVEVHRMV